MARVNSSLLWATIGSIYQVVFDERTRRPIEAAWQMMAQLAADMLERFREAKLQRAIFETKWDEFWGLQPLVITRSETTAAGLLIGARSESGRWRVLMQPDAGAQAVSHGVITWADGSRQDFFSLTVRADGLWELLMQAEPLGLASYSYYFGVGVDLSQLALLGSRPMTQTASGLRYYLEGLNLTILTNRVESPGTTTLVEVSYSITDFVPGNALSKKVWRLAIFTTDGQELLAGVVRYQNGLNFEWSDGATTTALSPVGDVAALVAQLLNANNNRPVLGKFRLLINPVVAQAQLELSLGGVTATSAQIAWSPTGFYTAFDALDQLGVLGGFVEYLRIEDGSARLVLSEGFGARYLVDPPIHDAERIFAAPMRVGVAGFVESVLPDQISIIVDEALVWAPPVAAIVQDGVVYEARLVTQTNGLLVYTSLRSYDQVLPQVGEALVEPWYLQQDEWWFEAPGVLRSEREIPDVRMWARDARAVGVNLYERWGQLLSAPALPDSPTYLNMLRGIYLALHAPPTPSNLAAAVTWLLGVSASRVAATITDQQVVRDTLGRPLSVDVTLSSGQVISVPYHLRSAILPTGTALDAWAPPARIVSVLDLINAPAVLESAQANVWARPNTFVVRISGQAGVNVDRMAVISQMIGRAKPTHTLPIFEVITSDEGEDMTGLDGDAQHGLYDGATHTEYAGGDEDMIFPDYIEVVNDPELVNADAQVSAAALLGGRQLGVEGLALGAWPLDVFRQTFQQVGVHLGNNYPRTSTLRMDLVEQPQLATDLVRALESWETSLGFSRVVMRSWRDHTTKPTSMVRVLTSGGALLSYTAEAWVAGGAPASPLFDVDFTTPWDITAVGTGGLILRSTNYGQTWSALVSPVAQTLRCIADGWTAGDNGAVARQVDATTWSAVVPDATNHDYLCCAAEGDLVVVAGEDGATPGESVVMVSTNGGGAWTKYTIGTRIVNDVDILDGVIWLATTSGIYRSDTNGVSWTSALSGTNMRSLSLSPDRVWVGKSDGVLGWRDNTAVGALTDIAIPTLGAGDNLVSVSFVDDEIGLAVASTGEAAATRDAGASWEVLTADAAGINGAHMTQWRHRVAVGTNAVRFKA